MKSKVKCGEGIRIYEKMREEGLRPSISVVLAALKVCSSTMDLSAGKRIHSDMIDSGIEINIYVANTLVDMYAKCSSVADASAVFERMPQHDVVSWNSIILGYAENGESSVAFQLYSNMHFPNRVTFLAALKSCGNMAAKENIQGGRGSLTRFQCLEKGRVIHDKIVKTGHDSDIHIAGALLDMYAKCGSMPDAHKVFESIERHDVVTWNSIILGYAESGEEETSLQLYSRMQDEGFVPSRATYLAVLKACSCLASKEEATQVQEKYVKLRCLAMGRAIHSQIAKNGLESNSYIATTLVDMYAKCGSMVDACAVFGRMASHSLVSWNAIMLGYVENDEADITLKIYRKMQEQGCVPNQVTYFAALKACSNMALKEEDMRNFYLEMGRTIHTQIVKTGHHLNNFLASTVVDMYAKCRSMVDARRAFDEMTHYDVVSWTAMILGYAECGQDELALNLYDQMQAAGCVPDCLAYIAALKACTHLAKLEAGRKIHIKICEDKLHSDQILGNCLVDFYAKCGSMVDSKQVFDSLPRKNLVTWNALIGGYSRQGNTEEVFSLFDKMQKEQVQPNDITFLSLLTVCCHSGLVDKGKVCFQAMQVEYKVNSSIEHYTCMVDLLARANYLHDALTMVQKMPYRPDLVIWGVLLSACWKWTNVSIGRIAFESILELDKTNGSAYVTMANIYASAGMAEESTQIIARKNTIIGF